MQLYSDECWHSTKCLLAKTTTNILHCVFRRRKTNPSAARMMHRIIFYYLVKHCPISIIFGRLIRKGCWLKIFQFPPHPIFCFYNYLGKQNTHFCVIERPTLSITHQNTFSLLISEFFSFLTPLHIVLQLMFEMSRTCANTRSLSLPPLAN